MPCGWRSVTSSASPGHGRYSGVKTPSLTRETGGRPATSQGQIALHCRRHTSDQDRPRGARSVIIGACASVDCHTLSVSSPPRLTATSPRSTTRSARVGASPTSSGTRTATGVPIGVNRRTRVSTVHATPKPSVRVTSSHGAYRPSPAPAPPERAACRRVSRIEGSAGPSARSPLTSQPAASARARRGGSANCSVKLSPAGTGPLVSIRCTPRERRTCRNPSARCTTAIAGAPSTRSSAGAQIAIGPGSAQAASAAACTSAFSERRPSPRRNASDGVVTQCGSHEAGRVRRCRSCARISGLGVEAPSAGSPGAAVADPASRHEEPRMIARNAGATAAPSGARRGRRGQRPATSTNERAPIAASRSSVSSRLRFGEARTRRIRCSRPTGPVQESV